MKVFAYNHTLPGVTLDDMQPYFQREAQHAWELEKAGVIRDNYLRTDQPTAGVMFEAADVAEAQGYINDFPMVKAELIKFDFIPLIAYSRYEQAWRQFGAETAAPIDLSATVSASKRTVKVFAFSTTRAGVTEGDLNPYLVEEARYSWSLLKAGIIRESYQRADQPGEAFMFECVDIPEAKQLINLFPLVKAGLVEFEFMSLGPFFLYEIAF